MEQQKLGELITDSHLPYRDAIHVALARVRAGERLLPGQRIAMVNGKAIRRVDHSDGIVDPFLRGAVESGQEFWMLLHPQTITSLRHDWTHPAFDKPVDENDLLQTFSRGSIEDFKKAMRANGMKIVGEDSLPVGKEAHDVRRD